MNVDSSDRSDSLDRLIRDVHDTSDAPPELPNYLILERLGGGGFGTVYRALNLRLQREVAIKVLHERGKDPTCGERLLKEARALARIRHRNVLTLYGVLEPGGVRALEMELIEGRSLHDLLLERGSLAPEAALGVALQICRGLEAVHAAGLVHRDVKTSNVLVEGSGRVVLVDLGLGKELEAPRGPISAGYIAGTRDFLAPEVLEGGEATPSSDIYSFGVLLRHVLTGSVSAPPDASTFNCLPPGPGAPAALLPVLLDLARRATRPDPGRRPASARAMVRELESLLPGTSRGGGARRRALLLLLTAAVLLLVSGQVLLRMPGPEPRPQRESLALEAFLLSRSVGTSRRLAPGERPAGEDRLSIGAVCNPPAFLFFIQVDARGRLRLLGPGARARQQAANAAEVELPLAGVEDGAIPARPFDTRAAFIVVASTEPLDPLVDSVPHNDPEESAARSSPVRLKPVAVRGLTRLLREVVPGKESGRSNEAASPESGQERANLLALLDRLPRASLTPAVGQGIVALRLEYEP